MNTKSKVLVGRAMGGGRLRATAAAASFGLLCAMHGAPAMAAGGVDLAALLAATPAGGWVKANLGAFSDAWLLPGTPGALPDQSHTNPASVVSAWGSMAWDSKRGNLLVWGGGHANYIGNEMYIWESATGRWTRGSMPSRIEPFTGPGVDPRTWLVVDDAAPQSAHTQQSNLYLPVNDMFITYGDMVYNTGAGFQVRDSSGQLVKAGPWMWDPTKANANQVGGTTGSGYDPSAVGGNMWLNRATTATGNSGYVNGLFQNNSTAYRTENGQDVVYITKQSQYNTWPDLLRYKVGDVRNGGADTWELVGVSVNAGSGPSAAAIDTRANLYVHTAYVVPGLFELNVWDLSKSGATNVDIGINLVLGNGSEFAIPEGAAIQYNPADGGLWLWDGVDRGSVYRTQVTYNADGSLATTWVVEKLASTTAAQPDGDYMRGVNGHWKYVESLGAFVALDDFDTATGDAGVWFYKPDVGVLPAVPEPATWLMWLAGLGLVCTLRARRHVG